MAERYIYIFIFLIQLYHTMAEKYRNVERYQRVNQKRQIMISITAHINLQVWEARTQQKTWQA
jgi:hypothetical protein